MVLIEICENGQGGGGRGSAKGRGKAVKTTQATYDTPF